MLYFTMRAQSKFKKNEWSLDERREMRQDILVGCPQMLRGLRL
jgi:hypothetical protein